MLGGPHVGFSAGSSSGSFYASLTGVGETKTPGKLTQLGDFTVTATAVTGTTTTSASMTLRAAIGTYATLYFNAVYGTGSASIAITATEPPTFPHVTIGATGATAQVKLTAATGTAHSTIVVSEAGINMTATSHKYNLHTLPTSTTGLVIGDLWRTGNTVKIVI